MIFYHEKMASVKIGSIEKIGWNLSAKGRGQDNSPCMGSGWRASEGSVGSLGSGKDADRFVCASLA